MAVVELLLPALVSHVRTARLVGVAAARRAGLDDQLVDELRLAIGEACARAVTLNARHRPDAPVRILVEDGLTGLVVTVVDGGPAAGPAPAELLDLFDPLPAVAAADGQPVPAVSVDPDVALAVLSGLVDDLEVISADHGTTLKLRWPLPVRRVASTSAATEAAQRVG